ncbi:hypothetical protein HPP92_018345 [Vanilla planifolia]|uniref:Cystathionine gamma-synthase n=1 Tax=Vanilla planifolia TaxID=51239 RepID=A0A835UN99_VANPL|nr:hypothetical protein HPP92_018345 [Vanilla planifolia]
MAAPSFYHHMPTSWYLKTRSVTSKAVYDPCVGCDACGAAAQPHTTASSASRRTAFLGRCSVTSRSQFSPYSALILRFPPNFVRQLSTKARRNCSNIGMAQIVAASWADMKSPLDSPTSPSLASSAVDATSAVLFPGERDTETEIAGHADAALPTGEENLTVEHSNSAHVSIEGFDEQLSEALRDAPVPVANPPFGSDQSLTVHAGERYGRPLLTDSITTPLVRTSAYWFKNSKELIDFKEGRYESYEYGRYGNPTTKSLEDKISALEQAESTLFVSSGMNASVLVFMALLPSNGHIVTTTDCYRKTRIFMETYLPRFGFRVTLIDPADMDGLKNALDKDNKALNFGADLVIHSATKYIGGHNDVLGGCISGTADLVSKIRQYHNIVGGVLNPDAAAMFLRGMKTLHLRVQQQNSTALMMAQILEQHHKIERVYYPGLPSHSEHDIAKRQMSGFGGVVSFEVAGDFDATMKFIDSLKIPYIAPSFGGVESIVDQPAIMSYWDSKQERAKYGIKDNLVRFSFGIEAFDDLKADILQALDAI